MDPPYSSSDSESLAHLRDQQGSYNLESTLKTITSHKVGGLQNLDIKCKQLEEFISKLPLKLKLPVNIPSSHPEIEVPHLEELVTG